MDSLQDQVIKYRDGDEIFQEGSEGRDVYLIKSGSVDIYVTINGAERKLATRSRGDVFGEMAMLDSQPRSASARAIGDVELFVLTEQELNEELSSMTPFVRLIVLSVLERYRDTLLGLRFALSEHSKKLEPAAAAEH